MPTPKVTVFVLYAYDTATAVSDRRSCAAEYRLKRGSLPFGRWSSDGLIEEAASIRVAANSLIAQAAKAAQDRTDTLDRPAPRVVLAEAPAPVPERSEKGGDTPDMEH